MGRLEPVEVRPRGLGARGFDRDVFSTFLCAGKTESAFFVGGSMGVAGENL